VPITEQIGGLLHHSGLAGEKQKLDWTRKADKSQHTTPVQAALQSQPQKSLLAFNLMMVYDRNVV
jgi:hypothetical protein